MATATPTQAPEDNNNACGTNREFKHIDARQAYLFPTVVEFCGESQVRCDHELQHLSFISLLNQRAKLN